MEDVEIVFIMRRSASEIEKIVNAPYREPLSFKSSLKNEFCLNKKKDILSLQVYSPFSITSALSLVTLAAIVNQAQGEEFNPWNTVTTGLFHMAVFDYLGS